jgi:DNA repair protein RadC
MKLPRHGEEVIRHSFMLKVLRVGEPEPAARINHPAKAARYWTRVIKRQDWFDENKEHFVTLILGTRHQVTGYSLVSVGTLNETLVAPREVFRAAIAAGAASIITMHNHPSGNPEPSKSDREVFADLDKAGAVLKIRVLDHMIVGSNGGYYSAIEESQAIEAKRLRARRLRARQKARKKRELS